MEERFLDRRGHVFISRCAAQCNYAGGPVCSHPWDTWQACNILRVVPRSHAYQVCRMVVPASPDIDNKDESFKEDLTFVSVSSADKDAEKTFDSFNRMHLIWTDRV